MLPAMSRDEILAEIILRPRDAFVPLPDLRVVERPGWRQLVTPSVKAGGFNDVSFAQIPEEEADAVIDATIAEYRALGCKFVWRVGPDSSQHLKAKLAARGGTYGLACGMACTTEMTSMEEDVREVDASTVDVFTRTMAAGWGMDPEPLYLANRLAVASPSHHLYVAYCDGQPAAAAGAVMFARSVYLIGGVTLERFRGRGMYRALVERRLADASRHGIMLATSHARAETSAPILEKLGFETLCHYDNYSFTP